MKHCHVTYHLLFRLGYFLMTQWKASFCFFNVCLFWESEWEWVGEGQRERERIPSRLLTVSTEPNTGLYPMISEIMTWVEIKSQAPNWLSHPGTLGGTLISLLTCFQLSFLVGYFWESFLSKINPFFKKNNFFNIYSFSRDRVWVGEG